MITLHNKKKTKKVDIIKDCFDIYNCFFCDITKGSEQILECKSYMSEKAAIKWANNKLSVW